MDQGKTFNQLLGSISGGIRIPADNYNDGVLESRVQSGGADGPFNGHVGVQDEDEPAPEQRRRRR